MRRVVRVIKLANIKKFKANKSTEVNAKTQSGHLRHYQFLLTWYILPTIFSTDRTETPYVSALVH